jgi:hypothetical protein
VLYWYKSTKTDAEGAEGLAAAYRLLGNIQLVDGKLFAAVGSVQSSLQIAADENDVANELASHEMLGRIQLSLDNMDRSDGHFASCQRLGKTAHQIEILGRYSDCLLFWHKSTNTDAARRAVQSYSWTRIRRNGSRAIR